MDTDLNGDDYKKITAIIHRLLADKGINKYAILDMDEEASEVLPGGFYPVSGFLLTDEGKMYGFWLKWDKERNDYSLGENVGYWYEADPSCIRGDIRVRLRQAKRQLGLLTDDSETS